MGTMTKVELVVNEFDKTIAVATFLWLKVVFLVTVCMTSHLCLIMKCRDQIFEVSNICEIIKLAETYKHRRSIFNIDPS